MQVPEEKNIMKSFRTWLPTILVAVSLIGWSFRLEAQGQQNTKDIQELVKKMDTAAADINQGKADTIRMQGNMDVLKTILESVKESLSRIERTLEAQRNK